MQVAGRSARWVSVIITAVMAVMVVVGLNLQVSSAAPSRDTQSPTTRESIAPDRGTSGPAPVALTADERRGLQQQLEQRRAMSSKAAGRSPKLPTVDGETAASGGDASPAATFMSAPSAPSPIIGNPADMVVARNTRNTVAPTQGDLLESPVFAQEGKAIMYAGNWYASRSLDGGATWTALPIAEAGPPDAYYFCCYQDMVYDKARALTIVSRLYTNLDASNGVIRLYVYRKINQADPDCTYTIDPGGSGIELPDYPRLGLGNDNLYVSTSNIGSNNAWKYSQMRRFQLDKLADCATATSDVYSYTGTIGPAGERVFQPAQGATDTMYWAITERANTLRYFVWPESSKTVTESVLSVTPSTFGSPDCRGGANNANFMADPWSASIDGFSLVGAVGRGYVWFLWNVASDANHPHGHIHTAVIKLASGMVVRQPSIWTQSKCMAYPAIASNARGDFALLIAAGGQAGGHGQPVRGYVAMNDEFSNDWYFNPWVMVADGTHNPTDGRYGDYLSIHQQQGCNYFFSAATYTLLNGTATSNINARYVEFGRQRDSQCWNVWKDILR